jgi:hypothetical protein
MSDDNSLRTRQIYWTRSLLAIPFHASRHRKKTQRIV